MNQSAETTVAAQTFCTQCGAGSTLASRFCAACGVNLQNPTQSEVAGEVPDPDGAPGAPYVLSLALAWSYYGAAVLVNVLAWKIYIPALFYLYLAAGFLMTRFVMQRLVEWHPVYNTVHNVFSAKLGMFFLWPFKMLSLLLKLSVNKVL